MKKVYLLILVTLISLMTAGFSYAYWTDTLNVSGIAETGELEVIFTQEQELQKPTHVSSNNQVEPKQFTIELDNLYPGALYTTSVEVENTGTIPAVLDYIELLNADQNNLNQYIKVTLEFVTETGSQNPIRSTILDQAPVDMLPQLGLSLDVDGPESTGWINVTVEVLEGAPNNVTEDRTVNFTLQLNFVQFNGYNGANGGSTGGGTSLNEQIGILRAQIAQLQSDLTATNILNSTLETEKSQLETKLLEATPTLIMFEKNRVKTNQNTVSLKIELIDMYNTLDRTKAVIYDGGTKVSEINLDIGLNTILFENLLSSHEYVIKIEADYLVNDIIGYQHVVIDEDIYYTWTEESCFEFDSTSGTILDYKKGGICSTNVVIPSYIDNVKVTKIGDYAFMKNQLSSVILPDSITTIKDYAFAINQLSSVILPNSITTIGDYSFMGNQLSSVILPDSITTIGDCAFMINQISSIVIPYSITTIESGAFAENQLTSVAIPNSVTAIESFAFGWNQLTSVTIPNSVITLSGFNDNQLSSIEIPSSVTTIDYSAFANNQLTSIVIPETVTTIREQAFKDNQLSNVILPDSITTIGDQAFSHNQLSNMVIPSSITTIEIGAFAYNQLTSITIPNSVTKIKTGAFGNNQLTSVVIPNSVIVLAGFNNNQLSSIEIPSGVKSISQTAFAHNQLTSVTIPNSVTVIATRAFTFNQLTSVTIPNSVREIQHHAFSNNQLTNVIIPNSVIRIYPYTFYNNQLTSVTIPGSVSSIGINAFKENPLTSVTIEGNSTRFNNSWIDIGFPDGLQP